MKRILVLGAGLVSRPLVRYLLDEGFSVTVASRTVSKAEALVEGHPSGRAAEADMDRPASVEDQVEEADVVVSLLPPPMHPRVARMCLDHGKPMVTTSYLSDAMKALDGEAKEKDLVIVNEIGVDPGIDHMSAMRVIDAVHDAGGKIRSFRSYCGGLPAPEANDNPLGYKFSWAPRGVLLAATNPGVYQRDGKIVETPGTEIFADVHMLEVEGLGSFEAYPNRNSLGYIDLYGIPETRTMYRGTLRNPGHCETWYKWVHFGLFDATERADLPGTPYASLMAELAGSPEAGEAREAVSRAMGVEPAHPAVEKLSWLGLFSSDPVPPGVITVLDVLAERMLARMRYEEGERDMIVLCHEFEAEGAGGERQRITSRMIDFGIPGGDSSMARSVSLPAAVATARVARGEVSERGVCIPVVRSIYEPVLEALAGLGIECEETWS